MDRNNTVYETRNYVKNVLAFTYVYNQLLDTPANILSSGERSVAQEFIMIDICANLQNSQFGDDRSEILERSAQAGITGILACATAWIWCRQIRCCVNTLRTKQTGHNY